MRLWVAQGGEMQARKSVIVGEEKLPTVISGRAVGAGVMMQTQSGGHSTVLSVSSRYLDILCFRLAFESCLLGNMT